MFEEVLALFARGFVNPTRDRADIPVCHLGTHAVAKTRDCVIIVRGPALVFAPQIGRQPQIHIGRETKSVREHADNGVGRAVNLEVRLRQVLRRPESLLPVSITGENGGSSAFSCIAASKVPAKNRLNTENLEKVW